MFNRELEPVESVLAHKLRNKPVLRDADIAALRAGHAYGETAELSASVRRYHLHSPDWPPGTYRSITGAEALALGVAAAGELADRKVLYASYPITPASPLLHHLARLGELGVATFQAEDEIAACGFAIGASYAGKCACTITSGPGMSLKQEMMGLSVMG